MKDQGAALGYYTKALELRPNEPDYRFARGNALSDLGKYEEAITDYDEAITIVVSFGNAYYNRGIAKQNLMLHEDALKDFLLALKFVTPFPDLLINLGTALQDLGDFPKAHKAFSDAISLNPDLPRSHIAQAKAYLAQGNHFAAQQSTKLALECESEYTEGLELMKQLQALDHSQDD